MGEKIFVGTPTKGLRNDVVPFAIDNDNFSSLLNAYQWRGRVKRKRGTSLLGRLKRFFNSNSTSYSSTSSFALVGGSGNLLVNAAWTLQVNGNIVPGSVTITDTTSGNVYTDNSLGILTGVPSGTGTINYATGAITISLGGIDLVQASFLYYPDLPVMGLRDLILEINQFPGTLGFDTKYSYNISKVNPYPIYDVSFYKNPSGSASLPGYIPKANETPTSWNGDDYQQFWTVNYQGALWATNGITIPFSKTNIGMQYNTIDAIAINSAGPPAIATITTSINHGLLIGDFVFINEVEGMTGINWQTGYVIATPALNQIQVEFPNATLGGAYTKNGIVQYLTNRSDPNKDCLRFYDGDPTNESSTNPVLNGTKGWVNFAPPLSQSIFSIADLPTAQYYLVGARMIIAFKDRLLFFGPVIQTSAAGSQVYLQDTVIYSQNGTPYYTCSYTNNPNPAIDNPISPTIDFHPILVPDNQTASPAAYFEDQTGFGGFATAGVDKPITTVSPNEDVLIVGFDNNLQSRFIYTGNDIVPFSFFIINSELGSSSTFSIINLDKGVITRGNRGLVITNQVESQRFDLDIPDEVFQMRLENNGTERITAQRDFINEWIYITYPSNNIRYKFPNQTLFYNYRDQSWAIFRECFTTYGQFRKQTGQTWQTLPKDLTWKTWNVPWNSGSTTLLQPVVIGGNQQGFVLFRSDEDTSEDNSLYIQSFSGSIITSPDHCLNNGDYITISGCIGTIGTQVNGKIFSVSNATTNTFILNPIIASGTYLGGGLIKRMYVPLIQTKQFPVSWGLARKTRLGPQQYLFTKTDNSQITLLIYLSQNASSAYNQGPIVPQSNVVNYSLIYSSILYTCPESTNIGLTPANINLNMVTASAQAQIWHRVNTSLIGDTVQIGFTLSDSQMRTVDDNGNPISQFSEIELHAFILDVNPSQVLA